VSNKSFSKSIGYKGGSGGINARSVSLGQAKGDEVRGFGSPSTKLAGSAKGLIAPEDGAGLNLGPKNSSTK
jgi:hypothetical protein